MDARSKVARVFDLGAYLDRIGLPADTTDLATIHRAHTVAIPFENLDSLRGVPVSIDPDDIVRKLVGERRGGYCFEQNLLFKQALEALGADVALYLARSRVGAAPGVVRPLTHLVLGVTPPGGGAAMHMDVGFGFGTLIEPLPFGPCGPVEQQGWRLRVVQEDDLYVLQSVRDEAWIDLYAFAPRPAPGVDLVTGNWFTCTNPQSPFVSGLVVSRRAGDGRWTTLSDWGGELELIEQSPQGTTRTAVAHAQAAELLQERFDLPGRELMAGVGRQDGSPSRWAARNVAMRSQASLAGSGR